MRKTFILILLITAGASSTIAQSKLGLKFSPIFTSTRTALIDTLYDVENDGNRFKFSLGLIYDHEITETYYFSTGLIFVPKSITFSVTDETSNTTLPYASQPRSGQPKEEYRLNYLQVPLTLKLYTNEIQPDMRVYFQVGGALEFKVFDAPVKEEYTLVEEFKDFDTSVIFGAGLEFRAGINTTLFGGLTYQRGLNNVLKSERFGGFQQELEFRTGIFSIDIGLKF